MWKRLLLAGLLVVIAIALAGLGGFYWAVSSSQSYYLAALQQDPTVLQQKSRELESRFTALESDLEEEGDWHTVLVGDEINGWLATKLPESFPDMIPPSVSEPRVIITPDGMLLAAQSQVAGVDTVVSVEVEPFATEEGDLAIQLNQVRAGSLPLPNKDIVDRLAYATSRAQLPIRWTQSDGRTVMIVERRLWERSGESQRVLETIELADGELFLSGRTEKSDDAPVDKKMAP